MKQGMRTMVVPMVVACAFFIENFDATVVVTAVPAMAQSLGTTPIGLASGITAYMLAGAVCIPISGWLVDRFGARTVFRAAIGLFTLASLACGLAVSANQFIAARIVQGIGGAMMVPVGRLIVLRSVEKKDFVRAMAFVTVPSVFGQVLGPPLGGFLITYASWRWIFFINLPIGLIGMLLVGRVIPQMREARPGLFDWRGFALTGAAIGCLMMGFDGIVSEGRPAIIAVLIAIGLALGALAVRHLRGRSNAVLDLTLLKVPTFEILMRSGFAFRMAFGAMSYLLPLQLQVAFGMTAFESGMLTFFMALGTLAMKTAAPRLLRVLGFRTVLLGDYALGGAALLALAFFTPATPVALMAAVLFASGLFRSLGYTAVNTLSYADIPPARMSRASSFAGTVDRVSVAAGVSSGAILLQLLTSGAGAPSIGTFQSAFVAVAGLMVLAWLPCLQLAPDAGSELSGRISNRKGKSGP